MSLPAALRRALEHEMEKLHSTDEIQLVSARPVSGGCINDAYALEFQNGSKAFLKYHPNSPKRLFLLESIGLREICIADGPRVPHILAVSEGGNGSPAFLLLELVEPGSRTSSGEEQLGRRLAQMHRPRQQRFGWQEDNYLGPTLQPNSTRKSWADFFLENRLEYMVRLLEKTGRYRRELRIVTSALKPAAELLGKHTPAPSLVHGDLWSGNVLYDEMGAPVLVDPAIYYGDREVDLAMADLFGGFGHSFFSAYKKEWALTGGWEDRRPIYQLYHLLHHALLFGDNYMAQSELVCRRYT